MSRRSKLTPQQGFMSPSGLASVAIPQPTPIDAELEYFAQLAQQDNYIYNPLIMNTVLTMMLFFIMFQNLFVSITIPRGGYQITYDGVSVISESPDDAAINDAVNRAISAHIASGKTHFVVSLFLCDPLNPANNHANMLLFEYNSGENKLNIFQYEPYGESWGKIFPRIVATENILLKTIIERIKSINPEFNPQVKVNTQLTTRVSQTVINDLQFPTEGGYCQMISLLQAYLFLKYGNKVGFTSDGTTPLGSVIGATSPSASGGMLAVFQLNVIRGFVIYIGQQINKIFAPIGIDMSIATLSRIQHLYDQRPGAPPIYLLYIDTLLKYVAREIQSGRIKLPEITSETMSVTDDTNGITQARLDILEKNAIRLLDRRPDGELVLITYKQQVIKDAFAKALADAAAKPSKTAKKRKGGKTKKQGKTRKQRKTKKQRQQRQRK